MKEEHFGLAVGFLLLAVTILCACMAGCSHQMGPDTYDYSMYTVVAYMDDQCDPCQEVKQSLELLEAAGARVIIVDVHEDPRKAEIWGVTDVPTFFISSPHSDTIRTYTIETVLAVCGGYL